MPSSLPDPPRHVLRISGNIRHMTRDNGSRALGITIFLTDTSIGPVEIAREVEDRGFESLWVPEHTHIPATRKTPYPAGEPLPPEYYRTYDPFAALSAAAAVTSRIKLGTGICLVAQHHEINLAKSVSSVDRISDGRFVFGIGYGWNEDEMNSHGTAYEERREVVREKVLAMKELWTEEVGGYDGTHVSLTPSYQWPKPVQQPHPPVLIGGAGGPKMFQAVADYADGWMPIGGRGLTENLPKVRAAFEEAGRDPDTLRISVFGAQADPGRLGHYEELGVERVVLFLPPAGRDVVLPILDRYVGLLST
jgi:probable F420-dependent oxidoreductase